jgi:uncharacterized protein (TIGR02118 family)
VYTVIYELYRKPELSQEEFVSYWHETHKPIAMRIPNVRSYRICPVTEAEGVEGEQIAGFVIFEFDSKADFDEATTAPSSRQPPPTPPGTSSATSPATRSTPTRRSAERPTGRTRP